MLQDKKIALNPYLPLTVCIADGEPHFDGRVYVFGSHDRSCGGNLLRTELRSLFCASGRTLIYNLYKKYNIDPINLGIEREKWIKRLFLHICITPTQLESHHCC